jgi:hypothetical protein
MIPYYMLELQQIINRCSLQLFITGLKDRIYEKRLYCWIWIWYRNLNFSKFGTGTAINPYGSPTLQPASEQDGKEGHYIYPYLQRAIHTGRDTPPGTPTPGLERSQPTGHTHCFKGGERAFKMEETPVCHNAFQLLYQKYHMQK